MRCALTISMHIKRREIWEISFLLEWYGSIGKAKVIQSNFLISNKDMCTDNRHAHKKARHLRYSISSSMIWEYRQGQSKVVILSIESSLGAKFLKGFVHIILGTHTRSYTHTHTNTHLRFQIYIHRNCNRRWMTIDLYLSNTLREAKTITFLSFYE